MIGAIRASALLRASLLYMAADGYLRRSAAFGLAQIYRLPSERLQSILLPVANFPAPQTGNKSHVSP